MNILRNRASMRKDSSAHSVTLNWRKTILVASQFFAFLHNQDPKRHFTTAKRRIAKAIIPDLTDRFFHATLPASMGKRHGQANPATHVRPV
jgi:hypothetical protein